MEQIPEEENKQDSEDNCELKSNIQLKYEGEESYDGGEVAFSVTNKKMKNNLHVPKEEKINTISIKSKQKKKKKKKETVTYDGMNASNIRNMKKKNRTR